MYRSQILGTGHYLPEGVITNFDLEKMVDTSDEWIRERTGIERRHRALDDQVTSDLALVATQKALKAAGVSPEEIELIIFCTVTGDQPMPSSACVLQAKLGNSSAAAFDLSAACSGFVYGLSLADQCIRAGQYQKVLVVGAEILTRFVNYKERETCILFGDGAGAVVLGRSVGGDNRGIIGSHLKAEGQLGDLFVLPAGGSRMPLSQEVLEQHAQYMKMKGKEIFKNAVRTMVEVSRVLLEKEGLSIHDVDWLIPHQANWRIMLAVAEYFGIPEKKVIRVIQETGNTSAATIPIALDWGIREGQIKKGDLILMTAFGAGLTSGSCLVRL